MGAGSQTAPTSSCTRPAPAAFLPRGCPWQGRCVWCRWHPARAELGCPGGSSLLGGHVPCPRVSVQKKLPALSHPPAGPRPLHGPKLGTERGLGAPWPAPAWRGRGSEAVKPAQDPWRSPAAPTAPGVGAHGACLAPALPHSREARAERGRGCGTAPKHPGGSCPGLGAPRGPDREVLGRVQGRRQEHGLSTVPAQDPNGVCRGAASSPRVSAPPEAPLLAPRHQHDTAAALAPVTAAPCCPQTPNVPLGSLPGPCQPHNDRGQCGTWCWHKGSRCSQPSQLQPRGPQERSGDWGAPAPCRLLLRVSVPVQRLRQGGACRGDRGGGERSSASPPGTQPRERALPNHAALHFVPAGAAPGHAAPFLESGAVAVPGRWAPVPTASPRWEGAGEGAGCWHVGAPRPAPHVLPAAGRPRARRAPRKPIPSGQPPRAHVLALAGRWEPGCGRVCAGCEGNVQWGVRRAAGTGAVLAGQPCCGTGSGCTASCRTVPRVLGVHGPPGNSSGAGAAAVAPRLRCNPQSEPQAVPEPRAGGCREGAGCRAPKQCPVPPPGVLLCPVGRGLCGAPSPGTTEQPCGCGACPARRCWALRPAGEGRG